MESFTLFRSHLAMGGIIKQQSPLNSHPFNFKNSIVIICGSLGGISLIKLMDEAQTFEEYANIVYEAVFAIGFTASYIKIVWDTPELYRIVDNLENTITKSK